MDPIKGLLRNISWASLMEIILLLRKQIARWLDYGPDDYAGITWSNTGDRKIFLGWMSNWLYANLVPTEKWRSAMTIPRELKLKKVGDDIFVTSQPVAELSTLQSKPVVLKNIQVNRQFNISSKIRKHKHPLQVKPGTGKRNGFFGSTFQ